MTDARPDQSSVCTSTGMEVKKRRPGRPVGSGKGKSARIDSIKPPASASPQAYVDSYVAFLSRHPVPAEPLGFSLELVLERIDYLTANVIDNRPLSQRIAELSGMSLALADRVASGVTPFPIKMLVAIASKLEVTTDYLLIGSKSQRSTPRYDVDCDPDERKMLAHYREGNAMGKAYMMFILALPRLLVALPEEASSRVIASLVHLHDAGAHEYLSVLPGVLGAFKARTGRDPSAYFGALPVFTPVHEWFGIYGPEQKPLVQYLSNH